MKGIYDAVITDGLGKQPFDTIGKMARFVPRAMRLNALKPVAYMAKSYFEDFRSHFMFSFHPLFIGGHPFRAPSIYAMIPYLEKEEGVWFAEGGMYAIVEALGRLFEELGEITTSPPKSIVSRLQRARLQVYRSMGRTSHSMPWSVMVM